jgi:hypothetical protein
VELRPRALRHDNDVPDRRALVGGVLCSDRQAGSGLMRSSARFPSRCMLNCAPQPWHRKMSSVDWSFNVAINETALARQTGHAGGVGSSAMAALPSGGSSQHSVRPFDGANEVLPQERTLAVFCVESTMNPRWQAERRIFTPRIVIDGASLLA